MNEDLHNIDDLFRNSINDHAEEVPPEVWNNIDHSLDKKQAAFYRKKYFAFRAAAILLLLIGGITIAAILHFNHRSETTLPSTSGNENSVTTTKQNSSIEKRSNVKNSVQQEEQKNNSVEKNSTEDVVSTNSNAKEHKKQSINGQLEEKENSSTYSADKNEDVVAETHSNKIKKKRETVSIKPVTKTSVALNTEKKTQSKESSTVNENTVQKNALTRNIADKTIIERDFPRTNQINESFISINNSNLSTAFNAVDLKSSVIDLNGISSSAKATKDKTVLHSWSLSPLYAQNINVNALKDDNQFPRDPRNNSGEVRRTEQETISFTAGISVQKQISKNIFLQSGISYFSTRTNIEPKTIFAKQDARGDVRFEFNCSSGNSYIASKTGTQPVVGDSIKTNSSKSSLSYVQVPLMASYKIKMGKFSFMSSAGVLTNVLLTSKLSSSLAQPGSDESVTTSINGLKSTYFSGIIQPQVNYKINDRISLDLDPNFNFSLGRINKGTAIKTYQNMISVGAGVRINL